ncbi:DUF3124 domain-containing protein [Microvirga massiliensis]|uniref:DUF3124 domain-containing protein n=1 Tax=Microvirga massiliensis TaxID=1033741 RepID=UPI000699F818|nr:DUF3124 domain-containing protein [Microvirga massiliensis]
MNMRMVQTVALLLLGIGLLVWLSERQEVRLAEIRNQARIALMDLMSRGGNGDANPLDLFKSSIADPTHAKATLRRTVYVPAYSAIRVMSGRTRVELATTLSIHNTSKEKPLLLERVDYHNTEGELVQAHLSEPVALKPLGTIEIFVAHEDVRGGTGANFIVEWAGDNLISEPIMEAVMVGSLGTTSYSFVSQGRTTRSVELPE